MPDYSPPYIIGRVVTLTASAQITGGQVLEVSGSGTVQPCATTASQKVIGVAADDVPSTGRVTIYGFGPVHETPVGTAQTVTAGDQIGSFNTPPGSVATIAPASAPPVGQDANNARAVLGVALTTATAPNKVRWMEGM